MNQELRRIGILDLKGDGAAAPVLQRVEAAGRLDGLLFELSVRQVYRNTSADTLEVVYTFPLPLGAVLLGLNVELGGKRLAGVVVEKKDAERQYEQAMQDGDAPIMLERAADGLYTAILGNFKPGEEAVIEYRYGQLLAFEQDRVRLAIPTTVAPRYGDPQKGGGLQPHQLPAAALDVEYGLSLVLDLNGEWPGAEIGCATHACALKPTPTGVRLTLGQRAWLDRDVVVTLHPQSLASMAHQVADAEQQVVLASFQPPANTAPRLQVDLKLLVDCSGSMAGDSIASARVALSQVVRQLRADDRFSFSRFGNEVRHGFRRMAPARAANLAMLQAMIDATEADLGGTEMEGALKSTIGLLGTGESADLLLITDGEIWNADSMIAAAAASKHRVFAVGVGSAPAESLLRRLAEATGGACEFATPGESLQAAIDRMVSRIRQPAMKGVRVAWANEAGAIAPDWSSALPTTLFGGDTLHVFAGFSKGTPTRSRLFAESQSVASTGIAQHTQTSDTLPRMAAAARLATVTKAEALALALKYQLVTDQTNFLVIHQRTDADKASEMAKLHQVPSMLAAGWGGMGVAAAAGATVMMDLMPDMASPATPMPMRAMASPVDVGRGSPLTARLAAFRSRRMSEGVLPAAEPTAHIGVTALVYAALVALGAGKTLTEVLATLDLQDDIRQCIAELVKLGLARETAWAVLVRWLVERCGIEPETEAQARLDALIAGVTADQWRSAISQMENTPAIASPEVA